MVVTKANNLPLKDFQQNAEAVTVTFLEHADMIDRAVYIQIESCMPECECIQFLGI